MSESQILKNYLTSAEELADILQNDNLVIIDTREPEDYIVEHIPGAISIYEIFTYLTTKENGGYEVMRQKFAQLFGLAGISGKERVVVYEDAMDNGYGRSCRGYFLLSYLGHKNVTVLHGGFQAWLNKRFPVTNIIPISKPKDFQIRLDNTIILTWKEMLASLGDKSIIKLDVRDHPEWVGTSSSPYGPEFAPRKGRLPGAVWIEWYNMMKTINGVPWFKDSDELKNIFANVGIKEESVVHIYCFKGARTSNVFLCLKIAGVKIVRNYLGSWNEWSRDFSLPIEQGYPKGRK